MEPDLLVPVSLVITDVASFTAAVARSTSAPTCANALRASRTVLVFAGRLPDR